MVKKVHNKFNSIMMRLFSYKEIIIEMLTFLIDEPWIKNLDLDTIKEVVILQSICLLYQKIK